jgi:hypothetical protein
MVGIQGVAEGTTVLGGSVGSIRAGTLVKMAPGAK